MAKQDTTKVLWRVQVRISRAHKWKNKGLFETRNSARAQSCILRAGHYFADDLITEQQGYGFGNTRVVRHVRGQR